MSKSILVIDTPKSCSVCKLCTWEESQGSEGYHTCPFVSLYKFNIDEFTHPQCPLQDTTDLLKALEVLGSVDLDYSLFRKQGNPKEAYNKLRKALGGKQ